jgi:hypothetical protein
MQTFIRVANYIRWAVVIIGLIAYFGVLIVAWFN